MTIDSEEIWHAIKTHASRLTKRFIVAAVIGVLGFLLLNYVFPGYLITEVLPWNLLECQWKGWFCVGFITTILMDVFNPYWMDLFPSGLLIFEVLLILGFIGIMVLI